MSSQLLGMVEHSGGPDWKLKYDTIVSLYGSFRSWFLKEAEVALSWIQLRAYFSYGAGGSFPGIMLGRCLLASLFGFF